MIQFLGMCLSQEKMWKSPKVQNWGRDVHQQDRCHHPKGAEPIQAQVHSLLLSFIFVVPAIVLYTSWWLNQLTGHCASDPLIDRNSRSQIKPDSVQETSESKDSSISPAENAAPKEEAGSTPDLGKHPPVFQFDNQMCLLGLNHYCCFSCEAWGIWYCIVIIA